MILNGKATAVLTVIIIFSILIAGCGKKPGEKSPVDFTLRFENINSRDVNGTMLYDIMISIDEMDPVDYEPLWMNIKVWIDIGQGILISAYSYKPERYDYIPRNEPLIFREDLTGETDKVDIMDGFMLTGLDETYENGLFMVFYGGHEAGTLRLPEEFS